MSLVTISTSTLLLIGAAVAQPQLDYPQKALILMAQAQNAAPDWMSKEEADRLGLIKEDPQPKRTQQPPATQPEKYEDRRDRINTSILSSGDDDYRYLDREEIRYRARMSVLWGAVLPGGGSFYSGRIGAGLLHVALQMGASVGLGAWYGSQIGDVTYAADGKPKVKDPNPLLILGAIFIPLGSKIYDMVNSYYYTRSYWWDN
jgi:hypothetical protein